jgi:HD superfamily phosphohydrolase
VVEITGTAKLAMEVAEFADQFLGKPHVPRSPKVVHDALWGTQRLHIHEVALVDTPLFQRLRRLHQTGFSYLTYPSTTHTRFEHSLGVLYQTDKLARALHDKYLDLDSNLVTIDKIRELRVAALLHDCSHGPFSHTSEDIYGTFPEMQELIGPRGKGFEGSSASEVLAYFILTSDPFRQFLEKLKEHVALDLDPQWLSKVILGTLKNSDPLNAHYSEILNGPFDADKLDYIFRDGHYSGLPLGIDLDRLWLATEIHTIRPDDVPNFPKPMRRLVMARSGINSLEQIVAARMNLTASLYHHHKIRACDCMLKAVFLYCQERGVPLCGRKIESPADFLYFTDVGILSEAERTTDANVREMLFNVVNRRLFKRAIVVSMNSFERPGYEEGNGESEGKYNLVYELIGTTLLEQRKLAVAIWEAAGKPGRSEEVWLDFPRGVKSKDLATTFVNVGHMDSPKFRTLEKFIPIEQWTKQYLLQKWRGHVFCRPEHVPTISKASEEILGATYNIKFNDYAFLPCNYDAAS